MPLITIDIQELHDHQEISIPKDFRIDDNKAYIKKVGNVLYIIPYHNPWDSMINSLDQFTSDFMEERSQPEQQERESFD